MHKSNARIAFSTYLLLRSEVCDVKLTYTIDSCTRFQTVNTRRFRQYFLVGFFFGLLWCNLFFDLNNSYWNLAKSHWNPFTVEKFSLINQVNRFRIQSQRMKKKAKTKQKQWENERKRKEFYKISRFMRCKCINPDKLLMQYWNSLKCTLYNWDVHTTLDTKYIII